MNEDFKKLKIVFTKHGKERMYECHLTFKQARGLIRNSEKTDHKNIHAYKRSRYGDRDGMRYLRNGNFIFTCRVTTNKFNPNEQILLVITMIDQRMWVGRRGRDFST